MIEIDKAIAALLGGDAQLAQLGVTGVYHAEAPEGATVPYIVFCQMAAPSSGFLGGSTAQTTQSVYMVKAIDEGNDQSRAASIAERVRALLHRQPLNLAPKTWLQTDRESEIDLPERQAGVTYQQIGANYRVWVSET